MTTKSTTKQALTTTIETIGPKTAKAYLESGDANRKIRPHIVKRYVEAMHAGKWELSHQGIAFRDGKLVDGQHRLSAIVQSGATVKMQVSRYSGVAPMSTIDSGYARNCGDRALLAGIVKHRQSETVAILNAIDSITSSHNRALPMHEVERFMAKYGDDVEWTLEVFGKKPQWNALIRGAFAFCRPFAKDKVEELAKLVVDQVGYDAGSAAHAFVKALSERALSSRGGGRERTAAMSRIINLIRAHVEGRTVSNARQSMSAVEWARNQRVAHDRDASY